MGYQIRNMHVKLNVGTELLLMFLFLQSSIDKTAPNLQRRILKLMKNPQSQMTVKICTTECAHDEVCTEY